MIQNPESKKKDIYNRIIQIAEANNNLRGCYKINEAPPGTPDPGEKLIEKLKNEFKFSA